MKALTRELYEIRNHKVMQKLNIIIAALLVVSINTGCTNTVNNSTTQTATNQETTTGVRVNAGSQNECEEQGATWDNGTCQITH